MPQDDKQEAAVLEEQETQTGLEEVGEVDGDDETDKSGTASKPETKVDDKPEWDKKLQERDQKHANERKVWEREKAEMLEAQEQLLDRVLAMPKADGGPTQAQKDELTDLVERQSKLTADSDPTEVVAVLGGMVKVLGKVKGMADELAEVKAALAETKVMSAQETERKAMDAVFVECGKEYGPEFQNDAVQQAIEYLESQGFSYVNGRNGLPVRPAGRAAEQAAVRLCWLRASVKAKKAEPPKKGKPVAADTGTGGGGGEKDDGKIKPGSLASVVAQMRKKYDKH